MNSLLKYLFLLFFLGQGAYAQTKYEKEIRIPTDSVPAVALQFVNNAPFDKKIKWYKEFGLNSTSFEAKTKYHGRRYSIEFNNDGILEDIEVQTKWKELPEYERSKMEDYLGERFGNYSINKLQYQFSGQTEVMSQFLIDLEYTEQITQRYEVVIHTKINGKFKRFELLFDWAGGYLSSAEFVPKNADNIEY